jgi:hypothetical protein
VSDGRRLSRQTSVLPGVAVLILLVMVLGSALSSTRISSAAPVAHLSTDEVNCHAVEWHTAHLQVGTNGCQSLFEVEYAQNLINSTGWNSSNQFNFSFSIPWIAELTPSGQLVREADPLNPSTDYSTVTNGSQEVNISVVETMNVTGASGNWTPNDTLAGSGPQWGINHTALGNATVWIVFHLFNVLSNESANATKNALYGVKFDLRVYQWPWFGLGDQLGIGLESLAAEGANFAFNRSSQTLAESWNSTNRPFVSLVYGPHAGVSYTQGPPVIANVAEQVGLFSAGSSDRQAITLLTFGGVPGNYSSLQYDPWVLFSPGPTVIIPPRVNWPFWTAFSYVLVAAVVGSSTSAAILWRDRRLRREGEELVDRMRKVISKGDNVNNAPR